MRPTALRKIRGVSLLEALVAMALMAIGMLGIVGMQSTMRSSSDLAKQRAEAVRLAQEAIEQGRSFQSIEPNAAALDWTDLAVGSTSQTIDRDPVTNLAYNATYTRTSTISDLAAPARGKVLTVTVAWTDRNGQPQDIRLSTMIAGIAPELFGTMSYPSKNVLPVLGRKNSIPIQAKDLGNGTSGIVPPNAPAGTVWVFNNATSVFQICTTTAASTADLLLTNIDQASCTGSYIAITGFIRYSLSTTQPATAAALSPTSSPADMPSPLEVSVVESPVTGTSGCLPPFHVLGPEFYSAYYCYVPANGVTRNVRVTFGPSTLIAGPAAPEDSLATRIRPCRYFDLSGNGSYTTPTASISNQNFLMIRAGDGPATSPATATRFTCPDPSTTAEHPVS